MSSRIVRIACLTVLCSLLVAGSAFAAQPDPDRYIVKFQPGASAAGAAAIAAAGGEVVLTLAPQNAAAARIPAGAVQGLSRNPNIEYIETDPIRVPFAQTTPYGIPMVQANLVSDAAAANRTVCIIDSGYYMSHEDLQNSGVTGTTDSGTGDPFIDGCGHGTHVAGTVAALTNTTGVLGVLPSGLVNLHIVKVFGNDCAWAYSSNLINAANACASAGANVISMSLGCSGRFCRSNTEESAFNNLYSQGILSIAAAGNDGSTAYSYPASYGSVVSVAALDSTKTVAAFSQKNDQVELAAPGVAVLSTVPWLETNTLSTSTSTWSGNYISGGARTNGVSGTLHGVSGDKCAATNSAYNGRVVLCQRGDISFFDKVNNVKNSGGIAAVVYNNSASDATCGDFLGTLGDGVSSTIPAISVSCQAGSEAVAQSGASSTVVSKNETPASGYEAWDGTSMATPHVSGVAALVWSHNTAWSNDTIRTALRSTAQDLGAAGKDNSYGYGLVQAKAALDFLEGSGGSCTITESPETSCSDGLDNDCDGLIDALDPDCAGGSCANVGQSCSIDGDCCSNKCRGPSGGKTCK
jgi:serine protease